MIIRTIKGRIERQELAKRKILVEVVELWKLKSTYHFAENLVHFVLKIECCLIVLSNFETEEALEKFFEKKKRLSFLKSW